MKGREGVAQGMIDTYKRLFSWEADIGAIKQVFVILTPRAARQDKSSLKRLHKYIMSSIHNVTTMCF